MSNLTVEERLKRLERAVYLMTWYVDQSPVILLQINMHPS